MICSFPPSGFAKLSINIPIWVELFTSLRICVYIYILLICMYVLFCVLCFVVRVLVFFDGLFICFECLHLSFVFCVVFCCVSVSGFMYIF